MTRQEIDQAKKEFDEQMGMFTLLCIVLGLVPLVFFIPFSIWLRGAEFKTLESRFNPNA